MAIYRLSCACGEAIPVAVGQAGGAIGCPRCGERLQIPKLRELRDLPPLEAATGAASGGSSAGRRERGGRQARAWGTAEAVLAAGSLVAIAGLLVAAWLARPARTVIDAAVIRDAIRQAPAVDIYRAWRSFADSGVARGATPDEDRAQRITKNRTALAVAIGLLGGIGGLSALGAAASIVARRRLRGQPDRLFQSQNQQNKNQQNQDHQKRSGP